MSVLLWWGLTALLMIVVFGLVAWRLLAHNLDLGRHVDLTRAPSTHSRRVPIEPTEGQRCPCCFGDLAIEEGLHRCRACATVLHWECHRDFGCPVMGCEASFPRGEEAEQPAGALDKKTAGGKAGEDELPDEPLASAKLRA